jgi:uncharacterized membrane protein YcaP (DUF421 family)
MWNDMWDLGISAPDKIIRTVVVYIGLAILLRLAGKRDLAQLNSFDLVVMLLLSNVVQNAVIGDDLSLTGGLLGATVLVVFNALVVRATVRSDRLTRLVEGTKTVLAREGVWDDGALRHEGLRRADVDAALRRQNANDVKETTSVELAPGGAVVATVALEQQTTTKSDLTTIRADLRNLEAKLDALLARTPG